MTIFRTVCFTSLLLVPPLAHATSFDCNKGRSAAEQMICHHADLSKLDDQLGKLYWQARRSVANPKALRADSDSKWAWREANCIDAACLSSWYSGRIAELQALLAGLPQGRAGLTPPAVPHPRELPAEPSPRFEPGELAQAHEEAPAQTKLAAQTQVMEDAKADAGSATTLLARECTAADPGIVLHDQCNTVLKQDARWSYAPHNGDWFCGIATVGQAPTAQEASVQEPAVGLAPEATP